MKTRKIQVGWYANRSTNPRFDFRTHQSPILDRALEQAEDLGLNSVWRVAIRFAFGSSTSRVIRQDGLGHDHVPELVL